EIEFVGTVRNHGPARAREVGHHLNANWMPAGQRQAQARPGVRVEEGIRRIFYAQKIHRRQIAPRLRQRGHVLRSDMQVAMRVITFTGNVVDQGQDQIVISGKHEETPCEVCSFARIRSARIDGENTMVAVNPSVVIYELELSDQVAGHRSLLQITTVNLS